MAGNTVYVQGSYVDVHDNEVVNLSIDKATVKVDAKNDDTAAPAAEPSAGAEATSGDELCHFIHPSVGSDQEWLIHD